MTEFEKLVRANRERDDVRQLNDKLRLKNEKESVQILNKSPVDETLLDMLRILTGKTA
jgi:hypothetical protein